MFVAMKTHRPAPKLRRAGFAAAAAAVALMLAVLVAVLLAAPGLGCSPEAGSDSSPAASVSGAPGQGVSSSPPALVTFHSSRGDVVMSVEVASTPSERARGLMGRSSLEAASGMIFVWDQPTSTGFWMKDTSIPLSIAFISTDKQIIDLQDMQPQTLDLHQPAQPFQYAVEANQGYFRDRGIAAGDRVELSGMSGD